MRLSRVYIGVIIVVITAISFFYITSSQDSDKFIPNYQYQVKQSRVISYQDGDKRWDIIADNILEPKQEKKNKGTSQIILSDIKEAKLYNNNKVEYQLDANKVIYFKENKDIKLKGNIKLEKIDGEKIRTEELDWIDQRKEFITDSDVKVELDYGQLFAKKMRIDVRKNIIDFSGQVEMEFEFEGVGEGEE